MNIKQKICTAIALLATVYLLLATSKYWLADYFYTQGDIVKAIALSPNEPLYRAGSEPEFILLYASRNIKLLKTASLTYSDLGKLEEENKVLHKLLILAPTDPWVTYQLALSFGKLNQLDLTREYLAKTLELKPDYKKARELFDIIRY